MGVKRTDLLREAAAAPFYREKPERKKAGNKIGGWKADGLHIRTAVSILMKPDKIASSRRETKVPLSATIEWYFN